jgi:hypothetical protein
LIRPPFCWRAACWRRGADHITVEALGLSQETAEALGIGYAPKGMMKAYVAIPIRLELTG